MLIFETLLLFLLTATTFAHPGHNVTEEASERAHFFKRNPKSVSKCSTNLQARGHGSEDINRRHKLANELRAARGLAIIPTLETRDFASYNFSHLSSDSSIGTDSHNVPNFAETSSCILQPDITAGPYLVTGESIRRNITNGQEGVPLTLDVQVVDTSTCEPVPGLYLDLWQANSTGVYSGLVADGNGNLMDTSNVNNTAFRGIQLTDSNGVVQFNTLFPGHYAGRTSHIHILTHNPTDTWLLKVDATNDATSFIYHASHVGQLFFDQNLITEIEATEPYSSNAQPLTPNSEDAWLAEEAASSDPYVSYMLIGDTLSDGILAWITIGIDTTKDVSVATPFNHS